MQPKVTPCDGGASRPDPLANANAAFVNAVIGRMGDGAAAAVSKANIREILLSSQLTFDSFLGCQAEDWYTLIAAHASDADCDSILYQAHTHH